MSIASRKNRTIFIHLAVWSVLFFLPHLFISSDNRIIQPGFFPSSFFIVTNLYHIGLFYLNAFVLYPLFFNRKKWYIFMALIAAVVAVSFYLKLFITHTWYPKVKLDDWAYRILFFPAIAFLVISTVYKLIADKINYDKKQKETAAEQLSIKLKFLRSQISPHFIFNVLTNLVSLARKKSEQLEPALIKLSELMRYMLYESDEKKMPVSREIEYIESYIDLQKLRFGDDVPVEVTFNIADDQKHCNIEPMMLIPFAENAFKHGINIDDAFIQIYLKVKDNQLDFDVTNRYNDTIDISKDENSGIGLENIQSRLMLLYPKEHKLVIKRDNNIFHVHLTLQLK